MVNHITDGGDPTGWFANPASQVSAHFTALRSGVLVQHVRVEDQAFVNGVVTAATLPAVFPAGVNPNAYSIGIEHEGRPEDNLGRFGCLSEPQFWASVALQRWLKATIPTLAHWTGHYRFDPINRTRCPGPNFPWPALVQALGTSGPI